MAQELPDGCPACGALPCDQVESPKTAMVWVPVMQENIDRNAMYLVKTNGNEWRDSDVVMRPGFSVIDMMQPNIVRGRPLYVARITDPTA